MYVRMCVCIKNHINNLKYGDSPDRMKNMTSIHINKVINMQYCSLFYKYNSGHTVGVDESGDEEE